MELNGPYKAIMSWTCHSYMEIKEEFFQKFGEEKKSVLIL